MNNEIKSKIELSISNAKHIYSVDGANVHINHVRSVSEPEIVYLLDRIEELQHKIEHLKVKRNLKANK
jgi:hypothetical protein